VLSQPGNRDPHWVAALLSISDRSGGAVSHAAVHLAVDAKWFGEPHIALDHVAHVRDAVAELQGPLQAHAEGEARVDLRVDAAGAQDVRVNHAAAAPLNPAGPALLRREPHVHLRRWLGE